MPGASSDKLAVAWRRVRTLWRTKTFLTAIISVLFWGPYLFLSRHAFFPVHELPLTWLDRWAGFQPSPWVWIYESVFLLTGTVPWLINTREGLRRYAAGFGGLAGICFLIFTLFPVAAPRPENLEANQLLIFITSLDGPLNAFPSLHAGCLVYTLALLRRMFGGSNLHSEVPMVAHASRVRDWASRPILRAPTNFIFLKIFVRRRFWRDAKNRTRDACAPQGHHPVAISTSELRLNPLAVAALLVWAGLILFATLATKQHYAVDLLAGGLIGWFADWLAWRKSDAEKIASAST